MLFMWVTCGEIQKKQKGSAIVRTKGVLKKGYTWGSIELKCAQQYKKKETSLYFLSCVDIIPLFPPFSFTFTLRIHSPSCMHCIHDINFSFIF